MGKLCFALAGAFWSLTFNLHAASLLLTAQPVAAGDLSAMVEAVAQTPPTPAAEVPDDGKYYSAQAPDGPPLPGNMGYAAWNLGDNVWLLDDLDTGASAPAVSRSSLSRMSANDISFPGDGGDGGETNSYTPGFNLGTPIDTNGLWLEITNVANGSSYLNLHNATNQVYAIRGTTNAAMPGADWSVETELFPTGDQTNVLPFMVQNSDRQNLFLRAEDWTGVDSDGDGITDWWAWNYFGTINVNATNLDGYGSTLLYDYQLGLDPNVVVFAIRPTRYVNTTAPVLPLTLIGGTPFYMAVLVNDNNTADAAWVPYNTNLTANLNSGDGSYALKVGLRGRAAVSSPTWESASLVLDTVPPVLTLTNPPATTVSNTLIALQGYANETLSAVTFDVGNANGVVTNQPGYLTGAADPTNYFTCPNVSLTSGSNWVTVHATDWAGNTTDLSLGLNDSVDPSQPGLNVLWPAEGLSVSGGSFTVQAQVSNPTATVSATIVDASGNTNTVQGLVEGNGAAWVENLPLGTGANTVTVTAGLGSGVTNIQTFTVIGNDIGLVINPLTQFNQSQVTVTGSVGDPVDDCVWVNGVQAYYTDDVGDWEADGVPVSASGTAAIKVEVYVGDPVLIGTQTQFMPQPVAVQLRSYQLTEHSEDYAVAFWSDVDTNHWYFNTNLNQWMTVNTNGSYPVDSLGDITVNWLAGVGGKEQDVGFATAWPGPFNLQSNYGPNPSDFPTTDWPWENASVAVPSWRDTTPDGWPEWGSYQNQTATQVQVLAPGQQAAGATNVYLVRFAAVDSDYTPPDWDTSLLPLPPEVFQIGNQPLVNTGETNLDGSTTDGAVWGIATVSGPAGQNVEATPSFMVPPPGNWDYDFDMQAIQLYAPTADLNRDGQIALDGSDTATPAQPFRFWINDSKENGDIASGADDQKPGSSPANYTWNHPQGRSDYVNFFPVALCLSNALQLLPPTNGYTYHLSQADGAVKFLYTDLTLDNAFDYLTNADGSADYGTIAGYNPSLGPDSSGVVTYTTLDAADLVHVGPSASSGLLLNTNWLDQIQANGGTGVIMMEGCATSTASLMLEIWHPDQSGINRMLGAVPLYLNINGVEQMFRHLNLRDGADAPANLPGPAYSGDVGLTSSMGEPANLPDSLSNNKWLIFTHGYNVSAQESRGWEAEMFKRFYWSGNKAKFVGVDWLGNANGGGAVSHFLPDYYLSVMNAFATAPVLATKINALTGSKTIVGHSLGCGLTAIALNDYGLQVNHACLVDAAFAQECFDGDSAEDLADMTYDPWTLGDHSTPNYPRSLWAADWYKLFQDGSDARQTLTWKNRFTNAIPVVYSFYSSTEDVLGTPDWSTPTGTVIESALNGFGPYAWVAQEKAKGNDVTFFGAHIVGTDYGGWGFNLYDPLNPDPQNPDPTWYQVVTNGNLAHPIYARWAKTPDQIGTVDDTLLSEARWTPLFNPGWGREPNDAHQNLVDPATHTGPDWIFSLYARDASGSAIAADPAHNAQILAQAIPALSLPVGAHNVTKLGDNNFNMPDQFADKTHWPSSRGTKNGVPNWWHSDIDQVAYPLIHGLFDQLVSISNQ